MSIPSNGLLGYLNPFQNALSVNDDDRKRETWTRCREIPASDPNQWRYDDLGYAIRWSDYGDRSSSYGWELDHYPIPACDGGTNDLSNLRALHWSGNASHGGLLGAARNALQMPWPRR
jgi:hypothetical protein